LCALCGGLILTTWLPRCGSRMRRSGGAAADPRDGRRPGPVLRARKPSARGSSVLVATGWRTSRRMLGRRARRLRSRQSLRRHDGRAEENVHPPPAQVKGLRSAAPVCAGEVRLAGRLSSNVLETGTAQLATQGFLHDGLATRKIPCWPPHDADPTSICFGRHLSDPDSPEVS
jgi:hypothetical protein